MSFVPAAGLRPRMRAAATVGYPPGATFGPRTLADFELVWLLRGSARWSCGPTVRELVPGSLLFLRPGMRDEFAWDPVRTTEHAYVHFTMRHAGADWPLLRQLTADDPSAGLFRYLLWLVSAAPAHWEVRANETLGLLLAVHGTGPLPGGDDLSPLPPAIEAVAAALRDSWAAGPTDPWTLPELAAAGSVSTVHLSRLFRQRFGIGPVAAVELLRLSRAETLLARSNLPVATVGEQCGFGDPYHFSRRFRAVYGVAPRDFRRAGEQAGLSPMIRAGLAPLHRLVWLVDQ
ncbi:MAG TPA: helix-turn-helix transcriptional regulator [Mycobacteriales bacterium]|nr:helix-turn-helix transcriptional regulator [Mycobacteriales bacterium]